jgi:DNA-binding transcriptional LysR family regulator
MELRHQRYFIALAEELHFGRAATRLKISQPALSKQIRELEAEVGTELFWRTKREVRLTPAGIGFLKSSRDVLSRIQRSIVEAHSAGRGDLGSLEIGYLSSASPRIVPTVVKAFRSKHPKVDVRLRLLMPPNHLGEVRNSQVDFLFMALPVDEPELVAEKIVEEPMMLAIPEAHPLAAQKLVSFKSLDGVPFVIWPRHISPVSYDYVLGFFKRAGARLHTALETFPLNSLVCAAASGIGIALVPECSRDNKQIGVVYRNLRSPRPKVEWGVVYRPKNLAGAQEAFLKVVREVFQVRD